MTLPFSSLALVAAALVSAPFLTPGASGESPDPLDTLPDGIECGLGKDFHAGRRAALRQAVGDGWMVFRGLADTRDYLQFRQDKGFWWLTGIESPNVTFVMHAKTGQEILFLPPHNAFKERWEGEMWDAGDAWVTPLTGIGDVRSNRGLEDQLGELFEGEEFVWVSLAPHVEVAGCRDRAKPYDTRAHADPFDGRMSREEAFAAAVSEKYGVETRDCTPQMDELRRVKTEEEIAAMRRASEIGAASMAEAIRSTRAGLLEDQLASLMTFVQRQAGSTGPAYLPIVGSGPNANVLHYAAAASTLDDGELVLLDYAPEVDHYVSDITRSWPVSGTFTPRMAELYDVVLEAQEAGIAAVKPGVTIRDINAACNAVIRERGFMEYVQHGACHYIGMEVHDVGDYDRPLEPGVAFTIEPGLYDIAAEIGIRIEDVVVVTEDGCEVISAGVPKTRPELEALVREKGLLDD